jgi:hypothetical protein
VGDCSNLGNAGEISDSNLRVENGSGLISKDVADMISEIRKIFDLSEAQMAALADDSDSTAQCSSTKAGSCICSCRVRRVHALAVLLVVELKPNAIPRVVRKKESWLQDRSILEVLTAEGVAPVYAYLKRLFNYSD